jgi:hypothetical protein
MVEFKRPSTSLRLAAWASCALPLASLSSQTSYRPMGNYCGSTATVPSEPVPAPQVTQRTTRTPASSQHGMPPVSAPQQPRTLNQTSSKPESTYHSGMSSQDQNPRSRTKSAPSRPQSSKSSSSQNPRSRAETLSASKRSSRSDTRPTSPGESDG